jgi:hypothetical protein
MAILKVGGWNWASSNVLGTKTAILPYTNKLLEYKLYMLTCIYKLVDLTYKSNFFLIKTLKPMSHVIYLKENKGWYKRWTKKHNFYMHVIRQVSWDYMVNFSR